MTAWVVVPAPASRLEELGRLLDAIDCPPERCVVVTTDPNPIFRDDVKGWAAHVLRSPHPMHFGYWLNYGFDYIADQTTGDVEVLCVGSSVKVTGPVVEPLAAALRTNGLAMVGPDLHGHVGAGTTLYLPAERTVHDRVPGVCFMVPLELDLRFDPQFRWWYSDDDLEMQARQHGPVAVVGGLPVAYDPVHQLTAEQAEWAVEDRARFEVKWGVAPH